MSDDHEDVGGGRGLVTITTDGMEALNTNGTKEIVPPDSPKKGDLYVLSTSVAPDGGMEIRRTLVDAGERTDNFAASNDTLAAPVQESVPQMEAPPPPPSPPPHLEGNSIQDSQQMKEIQRTEIQQTLSEIPLTTEGMREVKKEPQEVVEEKEAAEAPKPESPSDEQLDDNEELKAEIQKMIDECAAAIQEEQEMELKAGSEAKAVEEIAEHKAEVQEASQVKKEEEKLSAEAKEVIEEQKSEVQELQQAKVEESKLEAKEVDPNQAEEAVKVKSTEETKSPDTKVKRTKTLPTASRFTLPWQKKHVEDDSEATRPPKKAAKIESTTTTTTAVKSSANPLSGVVKNLKKGFKFKLGGLGRSGEDAAPGRIPQKSGSRPSPRIVSSLNITPTHHEVVDTASASEDGRDNGLLTYESREIQAPPESPSTRRRKELDSILSAMPPSPTPSVESVNEDGEAGSVSHVYDNLPAKQQNGKSPDTPSEEEICPSVAEKPVLLMIERSIKEKKARNMMEGIKTESINGAVTENDHKPPRPPPAKNDQVNSTKVSPRNLPPPPRPSAPPRVLQKSYTMTASSPPPSAPSTDMEHISPVLAPSPVHSAPVQMRSSYTDATSSLDRRKLYRSKEETRAAKMATLGRPMTMHETTFTVKQKSTDAQQGPLDEGLQRPKSGQKVRYEQRDSITLPKFLLGNKKKSVPAPVSRPHLATSPTIEGNRASVLKSIAVAEENNTAISPTITNMQCSMPPARSVTTASVCIQTAPVRPKAPVSSLPHGKSPLKASPSGDELSLPLLGDKIADLVQNSADSKSSLFAFSHSHKLWSMNLEDEEPASEKLVHRCLLEYLAASARLKSVDLQGEFASFHWQFGDLSEAGWFKRGTLEGYSSLEVYHDPSKQLDYVKLPTIHYAAGSMIYPEATVDSMLSTWIDMSHLGTPSTSIVSEYPTDTEPAFHPALAIIRLADVLEELAATGNPPYGIHPSITLAVLLSIDQCSSKLSHNLKDGEKAFLDLDPAKIILLCSPANCLVIFRIIDSEGEWNVQRLLLGLYRDYADSLEVAINACMDNLSQLVTTRMHLSALLQAIAPPDWIIHASVRSALEKANSAIPTGNEN
ncbi:unnamed protein product [Taenia asiatica]|uniref:A-kinase anchor protein 2-like n=1 Tax=Taenia asiatica TaxID=60517 RepID=A0A158R6P0_TAEAS|nr:unnamed protein product [Taenia asiatica]